MNNYEYKRQLERDESYKKMKWWATLGFATMATSMFLAIMLYTQSPQAMVLANFPLFGARLMFMICCGYYAQSKGRSELWGLWVLFFGFLGFIPSFFLKTKPLND